MQSCTNRSAIIRNYVSSIKNAATSIEIRNCYGKLLSPYSRSASSIDLLLVFFLNSEPNLPSHPLHGRTPAKRVRGLFLLQAFKRKKCEMCSCQRGVGSRNLYCFVVHRRILRYLLVRCNLLQLEFVGVLFTSPNSIGVLCTMIPEFRMMEEVRGSLGLTSRQTGECVIFLLSPLGRCGD